MMLLEIFAIAIGLAMDAVAVSIVNGISISNIKNKDALKIAFFFGLFQAAMPLLGWSLGNEFKEILSAYDHWIAFGLLLAIGLNMIRESCKPHNEKQKDNLQFYMLIAMSIATSIDAFATGFGLSLLSINIYISILVIGFVTFILSFLGVKFGKQLGCKTSKKVEVTGGIILILIGIKITIEHIIKGI